MHISKQKKTYPNFTRQSISTAMEKFLKLVAHFLAASKHKREGAIQACVDVAPSPL
jgi:hypothetical protein